MNAVAPSLPPSPPAVVVAELAEVRRALAELSRLSGWIKGPGGQEIRAAYTDADVRLSRVIEEMTAPPPL